jgi:hypothetical protein
LVVLATVTDSGDVYISNNNMAAFTLNPVKAVIICIRYKISMMFLILKHNIEYCTICNQNPNSSQNHTVVKMSFNSPDNKTSGTNIAIDMIVLY